MQNFQYEGEYSYSSAKATVLWDYSQCPLPDGMDFQTAVERITEYLEANNLEPSNIHCFGAPLSHTSHADKKSNILIYPDNTQILNQLLRTAILFKVFS